MRAPTGERILALALVPVVALIAGGFALAWVPSVFVDGETLPTGHDAVYHASRIIDAVGSPMSVPQFDTSIHAPEGSWVNWPWGFDALMAALLTALRALGADPLRALMFIPPTWLLINAALLVGITRALRLPPAAQWVAALAFAFSPLTQNIHGAGAIDHHFLELTVVLAAAWAGIVVAATPHAVGPALVLGVVLGVGNAIHNGLFVLQLPVLAAFALMWLRGQGLDPRAAGAFSAGLLAATITVALPSQALHAGFIRYDLLSWFHVYAASLTALAMLLMARHLATARSVLAVLAALGVASAPLAHEVLSGLSFMTADMYRDLAMPEMRGPLSQGAAWAASEYSVLIFLLPLSLLASAVMLGREREPRLTFFCIYAGAGALLLLQQYRFHQFGGLALQVLPLALSCHWLTAPHARRAILAATAAIAVVAALLSVPRLRDLPPPGGSVDFTLTRALYPALAQACRERPGIVLSDNDDGHYVTYLTRCAVVANNLVLGPESWAKLRQATSLLDAEPAALRAAAPWVRYVLIRRDDNVFDPPARDEILRQNSRLRRALLIDAPPWPAGFRLLSEVRVEGAPTGLDVVARVFEVTDSH